MFWDFPLKTKFKQNSEIKHFFLIPSTFLGYQGGFSNFGLASHPLTVHTTENFPAPFSFEVGGGSLTPPMLGGIRTPQGFPSIVVGPGGGGQSSDKTLSSRPRHIQRTTWGFTGCFGERGEGSLLTGRGSEPANPQTKRVPKRQPASTLHRRHSPQRRLPSAQPRPRWPGVRARALPAGPVLPVRSPAGAAYYGFIYSPRTLFLFEGSSPRHLITLAAEADLNQSAPRSRRAALAARDAHCLSIRPLCAAGVHVAAARDQRRCLEAFSVRNIENFQKNPLGDKSVSTEVGDRSVSTVVGDRQQVSAYGAVSRGRRFPGEGGWQFSEYTQGS